LWAGPVLPLATRKGWPYISIRSFLYGGLLRILVDGLLVCKCGVWGLAVVAVAVDLATL
jgi:hypothetical protein